MKASIEKRIKIIIGVALVLVVLMGVVTLYYSSVINRNIEVLIGNDIKLERAGQTLKAAFFDLKSAEREYLYYLRTGFEPDPAKKPIDKMEARLEFYGGAIEDFRRQEPPKGFLTKLDRLGKSLKQYDKIIDDMELVKAEGKPLRVSALASKLQTLREEQDKLINDILSITTQTFLRHQGYINNLIDNANRNLVVLILLGVLAGGLIIWLAPQKVTEPIKRYVNAVRELRDLKFDIRLPVNEKNELTELGIEINKFVDTFVQFDEMKRKKIQFEKRKLQVLADILNLGVVIISVEGEVLFLNAQIAKALNLSTESFQKKDFHFVRLPEEIKELFEDAVAKKEKFENRMIVLTVTKHDENGKTHEEAVELLADAGMVRNYKGDVANIILTFEDISDKPQDSIFKRISFAKQASL